MICTYCKVGRVESEAPCPHCGAPSPLAGLSQNGSVAQNTGSWGGPGTSSMQWGQHIPQISFDDPPLPSHYSQPPAMPLWQQTADAVNIVPQEPFLLPEQQSFLPVPYQQENANLGPQATLSLQLVPEQSIQHLLPAKPALQENVYIPPMYAQERPIIPRYRIVSGFISLIIVLALLCTGAGYYAKVTGKLTPLARFLGISHPPVVQSVSNSTLPDPPERGDKDIGPGSTIIPSSATTTHVDANNLPLQNEKVFARGQLFYVTFSVQMPDTDGYVVTKWYTNGQFFRQGDPGQLVKANSYWNGKASMIYSQSAEGVVELYWQDIKFKQQFAQRLYFVVR